MEVENTANIFEHYDFDDNRFETYIIYDSLLSKLCKICYFPD